MTILIIEILVLFVLGGLLVYALLISGTLQKASRHSQIRIPKLWKFITLFNTLFILSCIVFVLAQILT